MSAMQTIASTLTRTTPARSQPNLTQTERLAGLHAAQLAYDTLRSTLWSPDNTLLVPIQRYERYLCCELQAAWTTLAYWRRLVGEADS